MSVAAAVGVESPCQSVLGPLPSSLVFCLPGFRIPHTLDAGPTTFGGPGSFREPAFFATIPAEGPARFGCSLPAPRAHALRDSLGGASPGAVAVAPAPQIGIRIRQYEVLLR